MSKPGGWGLDADIQASQAGARDQKPGAPAAGGPSKALPALRGQTGSAAGPKVDAFGLDAEPTPSKGQTGPGSGPKKDSQYGLGAEPAPPPQLKRGGAEPLSDRQPGPRVNVIQYNNVATEVSRRGPRTESEAALTIQRSYRGYQARKEVAHMKGVHLVPPKPPGHSNRHNLHPGQGNRRPQVVLGPVIDITRLPRYGLLAPPLPRQPRIAGRTVVYDQATGVFTRNRGVLREALENKSGWLEDAPIRMWSEFARRQERRYVPIPPDSNRRQLPETQGYRLRILRVNDLPVHTTYDGRTFEFQLGVTLYDEAYGLCYGNTVYSQGDGYDRNRAAQRNAIDLDFSFDVFYHTQVSDPRCMAVVEIIMLERMLDGVVKGQYSLGWALLPLFRVPTPGSPGRPDAPPQPLVVPIVAGTPRYLLLRNVYNEDLRAPKVLQNCSIMFQAEVYPAMDAFIPLLPPNFLISYGDVVPGLRRFDTTGQLSVTTKQVISTLANPMLCPTHSVVLRRLQLALPLKLHDLLCNMDHRQALPMDGAPGCRPPVNAPFGDAPRTDHTGPLKYTVRVGVHNGRTFVGPCYELVHVTTMDVPGWKVLQVPSPDPVFDYVMGDVLTTVVVELVATPSQPLTPGEAPVQYLVGWTALVPFAFLSDDGNQAEVAVGVHRYALAPPQGAPQLRDRPPLNWRAMLGDSLLREVPDPMVEFQLFETGRAPIPPPLRARFAAIESQRAEEAALGERALEEVMAPLDTTSADRPSGNAPAAVPAPAHAPTHVPGSLQPPEFVPDPIDIIRNSKPVQLALGTQTSYSGNDQAFSSLHRDRSQALQNLTNTYMDTSDRDQLKDIASAMQRQIELLTHAVDELKEERKCLRNSVINLTDVRASHPSQPPLPYPSPALPSAVAQAPRPAVPRQGGITSTPTPEEIRRLMEMEPTAQFGNPNMFAGSAAPLPPGSSQVPSRVLLQQLYDAGMVDALPADVQAMLRQRGAGLPGSHTFDLSIEAKDPRLASDIVVQFLAFRYHDTLNAPTQLQSAYFTFQFYHFPPTTSDMAYLVQPQPPSNAPNSTGQPGVYPAAAGAADDDAMRATRLLMSNHPLRKGAGVVLKYVVDGSEGPHPSGVSGGQAAYEEHMGLANYLANRQLAVDMWDGESLLQVGTASIDLVPLLRQGRAFSELLVEVPLMLTDGALGGAATQLPKPGVTGPQDSPQPTVLSRGSVIMRLINIGKEPKNPSSGPHGGQGESGGKGSKRTRVRVRPAWEVVNSPIARELANGDHPDVKGANTTTGQPYLGQVDAAGRPVVPVPLEGPGPSTPLEAARQSMATPGFGQVRGVPEDKTAAVKHAILERCNRKSNRLRQLTAIMETDKTEEKHHATPLAPPGALGEDAYRRVQNQLLTDVSSARGRNKEHYIRDQLRKHMVVQQVVRPGYGEVVVYEHEICNPYTHEAVFELRISEPREVSVLTRPDEYRALRAANVRFLGVSSASGGNGLDQEVLAGNRLYLQAGERITIPFKIQSLAPPTGYASAASASAVTQAPGSGKERHKEGKEDETHTHTVTVEVVSVTHSHAVGVLELKVAPKPLIIDRTFRFYHGEHSIMRQTIRLRQLPGADTAFGGGALRTLAVAASHPQVITGTGGLGLTGGAADRDEVYIKYQCGAAPQVTHFYVLLYADRLLSRPIEVWQVYVHALKKVDIRAQVGQTSTASVVVRGAATSRRVAVYSSHPDELQATPDSFVLVAGALTELVVSFRPVVAGAKDIKVHIVDVETRELVYALIVAAEAQGPLVTRTFEVELPAGTVANKKITYTNPYQGFRTFTFRCNQPWLVTFTPPRLQLPGGATRPLGMTFDARAATTGVLDILVFVNDEEDRTEECFKVRCRIYR